MFKFRKFDENMPTDRPSVTVFRMRDRMQAKSKTEKRKLLASHIDGDEYFAVWTGSWSSDVFEFPKEKLLQF